LSSRRICRVYAAAVLTLVLFHSPGLQAQESANEYYEDASRYYQAGKPESALVQLKNALAQDDQHVPSLLLIGDIELQIGNAPAAEHAYGEAMLLGADASYVSPRLAEAYLVQHKYQEILQRLNPERAGGDSRAELLGYQALVLFYRSDVTQGQEILASALRLNPESRVANIAKAQIQLSQGQREQSLETTGMLISRYPEDARSWAIRGGVLAELGRDGEALEAYAIALDANPSLVGARLARAGLYVEAGQLDAAMADADYVRTRQPGSPRGVYFRATLLERRGLAEEAIEEYRLCGDLMSLAGVDQVAGDKGLTMIAAISHIRLTEYSRAIEYLQARYSRTPGELEVGRLLADLYLESGQVANVVRVVEPLLAQYPNDSQLLSVKASAQHGLGRYEQALKTWRRVQVLAGENTDVEARIAVNQLYAGDYEAGAQALAEIVAAHPGRLDDALLLARAYMTQQQYVHAAELAALLIERQPDNIEFHALRARALIYSGQAEVASQHLIEALDSYGKQLPLELALAEIETLQGDLPAASQRLQGLSQLHPNSVGVMLQRARVERLSGDLAQARKWAEKAVLADSSNLDARTLHIRILLDMGEMDAAEEVAKQTVNQMPDDVAVRFLLTDVLVARGQIEEARKEYQMMVRRSLFDAQLLYRIAQRQIAVSALSDAEGTLYRTVMLESGVLQYRAAYIRVQLGLKRVDEAASLAEQLLQDFPGDSSAHAVMGAVQLQLGDPSEAASSFERAASLSPDDRELLLAWYQALIVAGDTGAAQKQLLAWLATHPGDAMVSFAYAELMIQLRRWVEAEEVLIALAAETGSNPMVLNNLAYVKFSLGRPDAVEVARRARQLAPNAPQVNDTLGWILVNTDSDAEGLTYLREAVARQSGDPVYRYHLAVALVHLGRPEEAARELRLALSLGPEFEGRADAQKLYESVR
jgi:putative PEP-CTERM system TPR-repeat lipoprotein